MGICSRHTLKAQVPKPCSVSYKIINSRVYLFSQERSCYIPKFQWIQLCMVWSLWPQLSFFHSVYSITTILGLTSSSAFIQYMMSIIWANCYECFIPMCVSLCDQFNSSCMHAFRMLLVKIHKTGTLTFLHRSMITKVWTLGDFVDDSGYPQKCHEWKISPK